MGRDERRARRHRRRQKVRKRLHRKGRSDSDASSDSEGSGVEMPLAEYEDTTRLSHVGRAAYECLRAKHPTHHGELWNVTTGKVVGRLHQSPKGAWPGYPANPKNHSDFLPEIMGDILSRTLRWADVLSLGPPDGRFTAALRGAMKRIAANARRSREPVVVRFLFGNVPARPVKCRDVLKELTKGISEDANLRVWVGAWRRGQSWNHAKIIAVDGKYLHTGGHNLWDAHYLGIDPIHDLSLELEGACAMDGHTFADPHWDYLESYEDPSWGPEDILPGHLKKAKHRCIVARWPRGHASEFPPAFRTDAVAGLAVRVWGAVPVLTLGRYGSLIKKDRPSDDAFVAMMESSRTAIRCVLQDLGPFCFPKTKRPLPGTCWPTNYLSAMSEAIWEREVDVEIVLCNPGSIPGGLKPTDTCYGSGWSCNDVASEIVKALQKQFPDVRDGDLRRKISSHLRLCFLREGPGNKWESGRTMGLHSKHFIIDDLAAYIGSQNLYVCDLAEWGVVIDDEEATKAMMEEYWTPMWKYSFTGEDLDIDAVMDGLDIDRDGADPEEISDSTAQAIVEVELSRYGHGDNLEVYVP